MKYIGVSTPAWTILEDRQRGEWKNRKPHDVPGPGEYVRDPADKLTFETDP